MNERIHTNQNEQSLDIPVMPEVQELPSDADEILRQKVLTITNNAKHMFCVQEQDEFRTDKRLGLLNGHLVYFREHEPQEVKPDLLLIGAIAARKGVLISNPEKLTIPGLEAFNRSQARMIQLGIDFSMADKGDTIDLSALDKNVIFQAEQIILEEVARAVNEGQNVIHWLGHKKIVAEGRNVRTDILGISINDQGNPVVELNPHKRYSILNAENVYRVTPSEPKMATLLKRKKEGDRTLTDDEQKLIRDYQTAEAGFRNVLQVEMHRPFTSLIERQKDVDYVEDLQSTLEKFPKVFEDPLQTIIASTSIEQVRTELIKTGSWVMLEDNVRAGVHSYDSFAALLSTYPPEEARNFLLYLASNAEYYAHAEVPVFEWGAQGPITKKNSTRQVAPTITQGEKRTKLADVVGLPDTVLPSSVLGVSMTMGLVEQEKVYTVRDKDKHPENATVVYGTTDYANPVEMIMLANAATVDNKNVRGIYFADSRAHSVGSYMTRILIPSLVSIYGMNDEDTEILYTRAKNYENRLDVDLGELIQGMGSDVLNNYITLLKSQTEKVDTFAQLYAYLNKTLSRQLGVDYFDASDVLSKSGLTVEDLNQRIKEIGVVAGQAYDSVKEKLIERGLPENKVEGMLETMFGKSGAWDTDTRKFLREISGDESAIDHTSIDPHMKLAELGNYGITLGGNAWVVVMQSVDFGSDTVIAHKNTALGGNYTTPVMESDKTKICLSPIVRVVPNGNRALKGDGLDIGAYILFPSLRKEVMDAMQLTDEKFVGGQTKAVIEFKQQKVWINGEEVSVHTVTTALEPSNGGKKELKKISLAQ